MLSRPLVIAVVAACLLASDAVPAPALVRLPAGPYTVAGNPADRLLGRPIEAPAYDRATRCSRRDRPGVDAFVSWLARSAAGVSWGTYRCERWGRRSASLHAEGRAVDWHLDARRPRDARAARRLIKLLLATDGLGEPQALARRMGVQEIIWDCGYWAAGRSGFSPYAACRTPSGRRRRVDPTTAHRDHIHFGLTRAGAAGRTSFWSN